MHFLGFYTGWLLPAAVVGVLVFLYGVITMNYNQVAIEVCEDGHTFNMCPLCENCENWVLADICAFKKIAYLFDHPGTVFYAIFMSFWGKKNVWKFLRLNSSHFCYICLLYVLNIFLTQIEHIFTKFKTCQQHYQNNSSKEKSYLLQNQNAYLN